jgi:primosomal protein N' (replication factor Y)
VELRIAGPAPLLPGQLPGAGKTAAGAAGEDVRTLLFIPYGHAGTVTRILRSVKAASAAKRTDDPVQLRLDGVDVL